MFSEVTMVLEGGVQELAVFPRMAEHAENSEAYTETSYYGTSR